MDQQERKQDPALDRPPAPLADFALPPGEGAAAGAAGAGRRPGWPAPVIAVTALASGGAALVALVMLGVAAVLFMDVRRAGPPPGASVAVTSPARLQAGVPAELRFTVTNHRREPLAVEQFFLSAGLLEGATITAVHPGGDPAAARPPLPKGRAVPVRASIPAGGTWALRATLTPTRPGLYSGVAILTFADHTAGRPQFWNVQPAGAEQTVGGALRAERRAAGW